MKETVSIIGSHPRTREAFDWTRTDCDIWLFNEAISNKGNVWAKRADAIFQMHIPTIWRNPKNRNDNGHHDWLKNQTEVATIYMQEQYTDVPASVRYPLEDVLALLANPQEHFLSSSVPQAIALAILQGYKRIEVWGVAMETNTEYRWQREGVAFWMGFAKGRGIDTYFADPTYQCPMYGYDGEVMLPYTVFVERIKELDPQVDALTGNYKEASEALTKAVDNFSAGDNEPDHLLPHVFTMLGLSANLGQLDGARQENGKYVAKADAMKETSGEFVFSRQEFEGAAAGLQKAVEEVRAQFNARGGQLGLVHRGVVNSAKGSLKREQNLEAYKKILASYLKAANQMNVYKGAAAENIRYMERLSQGIRAAGGEKSEEAILESVGANAQA